MQKDKVDYELVSNKASSSQCLGVLNITPLPSKSEAMFSHVYMSAYT